MAGSSEREVCCLRATFANKVYANVFATTNDRGGHCAWKPGKGNTPSKVMTACYVFIGVDPSAFAPVSPWRQVEDDVPTEAISLEEGIIEELHAEWEKEDRRTAERRSATEAAFKAKPALPLTSQAAKATLAPRQTTLAGMNVGYVRADEAPPPANSSRVTAVPTVSQQWLPGSTSISDWLNNLTPVRGRRLPGEVPR